MGNTSSQPEPFPEIPDDFGDIVPETPHPETPYHSSKANGRKGRSDRSSSSASGASSTAIAAANGIRRSPELDANLSNPSKRKRGPDSKSKQKTKKHRSSDNQVGVEPASQVNNSSPSTTAVQLPPAPSQPTSSKPELPRTKKSQKSRKHGKDETTPIPSASQHTSDMAATKTPLGTKQVPLTKNTPTTGSPNPESSTASGGKIKGVRGSRTREKDNLKIGFYTPDEVRRIEAYKVNLCTMHGIPSVVFDEMVQHSERGANGDFPVSSDVITKSDFWNEIYALVPDRDRRSVYRFMRRHFQASAQKAHDWSKEQDEELIDLHAKHGPKWTYIGKLIGRSDDDVTQRWKNKLEHQDTMNQGAWSEEETRTFLNAVESSWHTMKPMLAEKAGKDFYELDERLIVWGNISKEMGYKRSRQQCADKWRKIVRQVMIMRANGQPDAVLDPKIAAKKAANWNSRLEAQRKSTQYVKEDSDDEEISATKTNTPNPKRKGEAEPSDVADANVESDGDVQPEEDELELPEPSKKAKKSKSKRKHAEEPATDSINQAPSSPIAPKKSKEERKREKKERREKEMQEQVEQEAKQKEEKAARKERKRKKKEEKERKRREEEERLAAEETSGNDSEAPEPPKKKKKKPKKHAEVSSDDATHSTEPAHPIVEAPPSPASLAPHGSAREREDAANQSESDSDGGDYDGSDVDVKNETDSDEL